MRLDRAFETAVGRRGKGAGHRGAPRAARGSRGRGAALDSRERAFAQEVAYGVTRLQGRLDHLLTPHVHGGLERLHPSVLSVLRMGLYQLLYLDVPDYAAVSQAVEQARGLGKGRAAGLVNAVLRAAGRAGEPDGVYPDPTTDPAGYLTTWGSHPRWLVDRWLARWEFDAVRTLVELNNTRPELHLVPLDGDLAAATSQLRAALGRTPNGEEAVGEGVSVLPVRDTLAVRGADPREILAAVPGFIQDPAAASVCRYAAPGPGSLVADLCAAPGGKALSLARTARYVLAADSSWPRLRQLRENVARLGLPVGVVQARAEAPPLRAGAAQGVRPDSAGRGGGSPDLVLVDVPCTGTGTLRRHPDARWRLKPTAPEELARVQRRILFAAGEVVPPGGFLVYSTCTLEPEENRGVVEAFLAANRDFAPAPPADEDLRLDEDGWLEILPQESGFDGAFAARMRRVA